MLKRSLNEDLQSTIILFTINVSSHKTDWSVSASPLLALSYHLYRKVSRLMAAVKGECLCQRQISINVNKLFIDIFVFCLHCPCNVVMACLPVYFSIHLFMLMLLLLVYLFIPFSYWWWSCYIFRYSLIM